MPKILTGVAGPIMKRCRFLFRALVVSATVAAVLAAPIVRAFAANSTPATQSHLGAPTRSSSTFITYHHLHRPKQTYVVVAPSSSLSLPAVASCRRAVIARERAVLSAPFIGLADRPPV